MKLSHYEVSEDPGDDSVISRAIVQWSDATPAVTTGRGSSACIEREGDGWRMALAVVRSETRRQVFFVEVDPTGRVPGTWRLIRLGPGVWDLPTSLHVPGQIHAFITIVGVPEPAPWERVTLPLSEQTPPPRGDR